MDRAFNIPDGVISLTRDAAKRLVDSGNGDAALLYLHLLQTGGNSANTPPPSSLNEVRVSSAFQSLLDMGLISSSGSDPGLSSAPLPPALPERDAPAEYSVEDIRREIEGPSVFGPLVTETQRILGKILSSSDLLTLFSIYDYVGLPAEVILLLINYCSEIYAGKYGENRRPPMRYIEKEAYVWSRAGVFTLELAEEHIKRRNSERGAADEVRHVLRLKNRPLSPTEEKYITEWLGLGFDIEPLEAAYDITVIKTGGLNWRYMNSILKNWHAKGAHTADEIAELTSRPPAGKSARSREKSPSGESGDIDLIKKYLERED